VDGRTHTAKIKPGYILMNEAEYLKNNHQGGSMHSKLLKDFTGKNQAKLTPEHNPYSAISKITQVLSTVTTLIFLMWDEFQYC